MLAVSAVIPMLAIVASIKWFIAAALIVSAYAFCFSLILAPLVGHRGLSANGSASAKAVYAGNVFGSLASLVATVTLIYASFVSL